MLPELIMFACVAARRFIIGRLSKGRLQAFKAGKRLIDMRDSGPDSADTLLIASNSMLKNLFRLIRMNVVLSHCFNLSSKSIETSGCLSLRAGGWQRYHDTAGSP